MGVILLGRDGISEPQERDSAENLCRLLAEHGKAPFRSFFQGWTSAICDSGPVLGFRRAQAPPTSSHPFPLMALASAARSDSAGELGRLPIIGWEAVGT